MKHLILMSFLMLTMFMATQAGPSPQENQDGGFSRQLKEHRAELDVLKQQLGGNTIVSGTSSAEWEAYGASSGTKGARMKNIDVTNGGSVDWMETPEVFTSLASIKGKTKGNLGGFWQTTGVQNLYATNLHESKRTFSVLVYSHENQKDAANILKNNVVVNWVAIGQAQLKPHHKEE